MSAAAAIGQTPAGTMIVNAATLTYRVESGTQTSPSNVVTIRVAELLDIRLIREGDAPLPRDGRAAAIAFTLANPGNGMETFAVTAMLPGLDGAPMLAIDSDGDGVYDPARDAPITNGTTPVLAAGTTLRLFAIIPTGTTPGGALVVTARASTGSGAAGTRFVGLGDDGVDAVVGMTGASASVSVPLDPASADPVLVKRHTVLGSDGSTRASRGALLTYTLEARFPSAVTAAVIGDVIPDGTVFVPGSVRLDGLALTDAVDADAGSFDGRAVAVALGDVPASATRSVQFQTRIQ